MPDHCPRAALVAQIAHMACIASGEWMLALAQIDHEDAQHLEDIADDMALAAQHFAASLSAFDTLAREPGHARRRSQAEKLRRDVVDHLGPEGVEAFFADDVAAFICQPLDLAPDAIDGELVQ